MSLGPPEILLCLFVALVVLGPEQLPKAARSLGKAVREFRRFNQNLQRQVDDFISLDERQNTKPVSQSLPDTPEVPNATKPAAHPPAPRPEFVPDPADFKQVDEVLDTRPIAPPQDDPSNGRHFRDDEPDE